MLVVSCNQNDFEYDIHSLVKAFYPAEEVKVFLEHDYGNEGISSSPHLPDINIYFNEDRVLLLLYADGETSVLGADMDEAASRIERKNCLKQLIYAALAQHTGRELPWGALTGIRPVKLAAGRLDAGHTADDVIRHMQETYFCGENKAALATDIALRERSILKDLDYKDTYSLYISIPFCQTRCLYCSFTSYPLSKYQPRLGEYLEALFQEIDMCAQLYPHSAPSSIYIGGGTPTSLAETELARLLNKIKTSFDLGGVHEYSVEAGRPDSINKEKLALLRSGGVGRISINPQTMNDVTLERIGRAHGAQDVVDAFWLARDAGFDNINMDIILGLPAEGPREVERTMAAVRELGPDSLSIHSLAIKRGAKMTEWVGEHGLDLLKNDEETMQIAADTAASLGMQPYYLYRQKNMAGNFENVGYARPGCYCLYNILTMGERQNIVALGADVLPLSKRIHADGDVERLANVKEVELYMAQMAEKAYVKST